MIIDPVVGEREIIEKALDEYGLVVTGNMMPEEFTNDRLLLIELKSELRSAHNKIELQKELLQDKSVQIDKLFSIVGTAVQREHTVNITMDRSEINTDGDVSYAKNNGKAGIVTETKQTAPSEPQKPVTPAEVKEPVTPAGETKQAETPVKEKPKLEVPKNSGGF